MPGTGLGHWPTPLHRLERFSEEIGVEVWAKRDDVQGVALAGNKLRKFDLVLGAARASGADTLVTTGALQSNSARTGAAMAGALGMRCVLLLTGDEPDALTGNLLLDAVVGAEVRFVGDISWGEVNDMVNATMAELNAGGSRAVSAPVGASSALGSLGFARGMLELDAQLTDLGLVPSALVHATSSGGTHAGLLVGRALAGRDIRIIGVDTARAFEPLEDWHVGLAAEAAALIGAELDVVASDTEVLSTQVGPAYGEPTPEALVAIDLLARTEAIIVDPVYSGKGLAGLVELARTGQVTGPVVFWHTGGYHALFDPRYGAAVAPHR